MKLKKILMVLCGVLLLAGVWFLRFCQPEYQVQRHQQKLMASLESKNFEKFGSLLAGDYKDRWDYSKGFITDQIPPIFKQFLTLEIQRTEVSSASDGTNWRLEENIRLNGKGVALGEFVQTEVNKLKEPFTFVWRKKGSAWEWELISVDHPTLPKASDYQ